MHHHNFTELGRALAHDDWGHNNDKTQYDTLKGTNDERMAMYLLAYVAKTLCAITELVRRDMRERREWKDDRSDGMLQGLRTLNTDDLLPDTSALSARARKAIIRGKCRFRSDCSPERLSELKNCGPATTREIALWLENNP